MAKKSDKVKLSPPWDGHMNMLASFFRGDDRVRVGCGTNKGVGTIEVFDTKMYVALEQVLRKRLRFGNVVLKIDLVPANGVKTSIKGEMSDLMALKYVLSKNPAFAKFVSRKTEVGNSVFVMFRPVVLMWYNDNLGSPYKQSASVYEAESVRVFKDELGVTYATEPDRRAKAEEDLTSITVCASMASGKWKVSGVAVKEVAKSEQFGGLLTAVKGYLDKNITIKVGRVR